MTTGQQTSEPRNPLEDTIVVDADVHLGYGEEGPELQREYARRMKKPYGDYYHPDKGGSAIPTAGLPRDLGGKKELVISPAETPEDIQRDLCDQMGVDYPIINSLAPVDRVYQERLAIELMKAANDVLIERFLDVKDHFYGVATIATRSPAKAAEEIDRIGDEDGIIGVFMVPGHKFRPPAGDPSQDIIYQALQDNDLVPVFHPGSSETKFSVFNEFETMFSVHSLGFHYSAMMDVTTLIAQGVPEKFPDLDFVFVESGLMWLPNTMARLNREYGQWKSELPLLEKSPEEYIRESFYFTNQMLGEPNDPTHMKEILNIIGEDMMVFSTDFPHYDFDHPSAFDKYLQHFSTKGREKVLHGNAAEIFGLSI